MNLCINEKDENERARISQWERRGVARRPFALALLHRLQTRAKGLGGGLRVRATLR